MKEEMLRTFAEAHERLLTSATVAAARGTVRVENWGPREILAHIAAWEAEGCQRMPLLAAGAPGKEYDVDAFNAAAVAAIGDQSFEQVSDMLRQAHLRLVHLLASMEDSAFAPGGCACDWVTALTRHSNEHARELEFSS